MILIQREACLRVLCFLNSHIPGLLPLPSQILVVFPHLFSPPFKKQTLFPSPLPLSSLYLISFSLSSLALGGTYMHEKERRKMQERRVSSIVLKPNTILASAFEFFYHPYLCASGHQPIAIYPHTQHDMGIDQKRLHFAFNIIRWFL